MPDARERYGRLRDAVEGLRTKGVKGLDRHLMTVGAVLLPVGVLLVLLGWFGASRTPYLFEQVPYLISGGLLGLTLAVTGGFLYFGYWLTRLVADGRDRDAALRAVIAELVASGAAAPLTPELEVSSGTNGSYVATARGNLFHRPDCVIVAGKPKLRKVKVGQSGFEPCRICNPGDDG